MEGPCLVTVESRGKLRELGLWMRFTCCALGLMAQAWALPYLLSCYVAERPERAASLARLPKL